MNIPVSRVCKKTRLFESNSAETLGIFKIRRCDLTYGNGDGIASRMFKKVVQRGRREQRGEA